MPALTFMQMEWILAGAGIDIQTRNGLPSDMANFGVRGPNLAGMDDKVVRTVTRRENYETKVEAWLLPLMEKYGFELFDVEYIKEAGNWYLRAYVDKDGGFTVDDCELISRQLSDWLDQEDFIADSYILEVSSPGLGRPLKKEKDFQRSLQEPVDIKLYKALDGQKDFHGILTAYDKDKVSITKAGGEVQEINRSDIALIRLAFDF